MVHQLIRVAQDLYDAIKNRNEKGLRFDNTEYWKTYYKKKIKKNDFDREKRYSQFLSEFNSKSKLFLDIGTGYGFLPLQLVKLGKDVTCLDKYRGMIKEAKKYFRKNNEEIKIVQSDIVDMPFGNNQFDVITAMSILEHFPLEETKDNIVIEIKRVLKTGGILFVHVPVKSYVTLLKKWYRKVVKKDIPEWACDDDGDVTHKVWFTAEEYLNLLREFGFRVKYISYNFSRSNETNVLMLTINRVLSGYVGKFRLIEGGKMNLRNRIISKFATSTAFVCIKK